MNIRLLAVCSTSVGRLWYRNELEHYGCEIHTAYNDRSCIEVAIAIRPHILIMESFPLRGLKDKPVTYQDLAPNLGSIPVILIDVEPTIYNSAHDSIQPDRRRACELAGAYGKWSRSAEELIQIVDIALGRNRRRSPHPIQSIPIDVTRLGNRRPIALPRLFMTQERLN